MTFFCNYSYLSKRKLPIRRLESSLMKKKWNESNRHDILSKFNWVLTTCIAGVGWQSLLLNMQCDNNHKVYIHSASLPFSIFVTMSPRTRLDWIVRQLYDGLRMPHYITAAFPLTCDSWKFVSPRNSFVEKMLRHMWRIFSRRFFFGSNNHKQYQRMFVKFFFVSCYDN